MITTQELVEDFKRRVGLILAHANSSLVITPRTDYRQDTYAWRVREISNTSGVTVQDWFAVYFNDQTRVIYYNLK